jgi:hypothetical protein
MSADILAARSPLFSGLARLVKCDRNDGKSIKLTGFTFQKERIMSTQVMDQVTSQASLSTDQQARAAAFAEQEKLNAGAAAATALFNGVGTSTYGIGISDNGGGFAKIGWNVSNSLQSYCTQQPDWVGVFTNSNQALVNPNTNYLGGAKGWALASSGGPFVSGVALQAGMVAAYIVKNAAGVYVAVAISAPFPG